VTRKLAAVPVAAKNHLVSGIGQLGQLTTNQHRVCRLW
jgi:hypothetical protein